MPKLKQNTIVPTPEEDAEIDKQIKADSNDFEWTDETFRLAKSFEDSDLPKSFKKAVRRGRPKLEKPKVLLSVRYSQEVVDFFKATGKGWQTRMDEALQEYMVTHQ